MPEPDSPTMAMLSPDLIIKSMDAKICNIPAALIMEDVALSKDMMQPDGLHPNAKGQPAIADKVWPQLLPLLK